MVHENTLSRDALFLTYEEMISLLEAGGNYCICLIPLLRYRRPSPGQGHKNDIKNCNYVYKLFYWCKSPMERNCLFLEVQA